MFWVIFGTVLGIVVTVVGSILATFFQMPKGQRSMRMARRKLWGNCKSKGKRAWGEHRRRKLATPRGQLKAKRKAQPHRLTFGHVRTADDPTRSRRAAGWVGTRAKSGGTRAARRVGTGTKRAGTAVWNRYRTARANRTPKTGTGLWDRVSGYLTGYGTPRDPSHPRYRKRMGECLATTTRGGECHNLELVGPDGEGTGYCYIAAHRRQVLQEGAKKEKPWANGAKFSGGARLSGAVTRKGASESAPKGSQAHANAKARVAASRATPTPRTTVRRPATGGGRVINNSGVMNLGSGKVNVTGSKWGPDGSATAPAPKPPKPGRVHVPNGGKSTPGHQGGITNHGGDVNVSGQAFGNGSKVVHHPPSGGDAT